MVSNLGSLKTVSNARVLKLGIVENCVKFDGFKLGIVENCVKCEGSQTWDC